MDDAMAHIGFVACTILVFAFVIFLLVNLTKSSEDTSASIHGTQVCVTHRPAGTWNNDFDKCVDKSLFK